MVVTTARAMTNAARATVAGATRTTAMMAMTTAATMTPNGDKHNNGVGAGLTSPVGIGKDGGHDRWLCWGWRGGVADYWGTKTKKEKAKILPVDGADT